MSNDGTAKDEAELVEKPTEPQTKPAKDKKTKKDKVKPMAKVCISFKTIKQLIIS